LTHTFTSNGNNSPADFLQAVYRQGAGNSFDAVAIHPYTYPFVPSYTGEPTGWKSLKDARAVIVANGQPDKKIWITEYGAPTGGPVRQATSGTTRTALGSDHVTEALSSRILAEATDFVQNNTWIDVFFWYSYKDKDSHNYSSTENFYGLLRSDGTQKPSYAIFRHAIQTSR
jgi:exo-beta-1,3-glucanase (GH17 family)